MDILEACDLDEEEDEYYSPSPPSSCDLTDIQSEVLAWAISRENNSSGQCRGGIAKLPTGKGKTRLCLELIKRNPKPRTLVLCTKNVIHTWRSEHAKWAKDDLSIFLVTSENVSSLFSKQHKRCYDVIVANYEVVRGEYRKKLALHRDHKNPDNTIRKKLKREMYFYTRTWDRVILDEGQKIRNGVQVTRAVCQLKTKHPWIFTATLINNGVQEFYEYLGFLGLAPGMKKKQWLRGICAGGPEARDLDRTLQQCMWCVKRDDAVAPSSSFSPLEPNRDEESLPPLHLYSYRHPFMSEAEREEYIAQYEHMISSARQSVQSSSALDRREQSGHAFACLGRMRQICCGLNSMGLDSTRMRAFAAYLSTRACEGDKILVFSEYVGLLHQTARKIEEMQLDDEACPESVYMRTWTMLEGSMSMSKREAAIEEFKTNPRCAFLLISETMGCEGLNLQEANKVFFLNSYYNPAMEEQAIGRAHRKGQKRAVEVVYFLISGTFEESIYSLCRRKAYRNQRMEEELDFSGAIVAKEKLPSLSSAKSLLELDEATREGEGGNNRRNLVDESQDVSLVIESRAYADWTEAKKHSEFIISQETTHQKENALGVGIYNVHTENQLDVKLFCETIRTLFRACRINALPSGTPLFCVGNGRDRIVTTDYSPPMQRGVPSFVSGALAQCECMASAPLSSTCTITSEEEVKGKLFVDLSSPNLVSELREALAPFSALINSIASNGTGLSDSDMVIRDLVRFIYDNAPGGLTNGEIAIALEPALKISLCHGEKTYCAGCFLGEVEAESIRIGMYYIYTSVLCITNTVEWSRNLLLNTIQQ